mmetsp:Transcript_45070/g.119575  ORF Transcript_45070/g.119575 Transcript_45070/m.119575 type:complete len:240 (-) Transcript_45070:2297-3016(-)
MTKYVDVPHGPHAQLCRNPRLVCPLPKERGTRRQVGHDCRRELRRSRGTPTQQALPGQSGPCQHQPGKQKSGLPRVRLARTRSLHGRTAERRQTRSQLRKPQRPLTPSVETWTTNARRPSTRTSRVAVRNPWFARKRKARAGILEHPAHSSDTWMPKDRKIEARARPFGPHSPCRAVQTSSLGASMPRVEAGCPRPVSTGSKQSSHSLPSPKKWIQLPPRCNCKVTTSHAVPSFDIRTR